MYGWNNPQRQRTTTPFGLVNTERRTTSLCAVCIFHENYAIASPSLSRSKAHQSVKCLNASSVTTSASMKKSPLKRKSAMKANGGFHGKARKRINPVSKKRKQEQVTYSKLRKEYLTARPRCECCDLAPSTEIHHRRGRWKSRLNATEWWLGICRPCHDYIHGNPAWAYERGYLIER